MMHLSFSGVKLGSARVQEDYFKQDEKSTIYTTIHELSERVQFLRDQIEDNTFGDDLTRGLMLTAAASTVLITIIYKLTNMSNLWKKSLNKDPENGQQPFAIPMTNIPAVMQRQGIPLDLPRIRIQSEA